MAKRPAFQFYPSDWLNDLGLRQCSPMARGVWVDLMCLMHDGEPYGHLATKSGELTIPWLANRLGMRKGILLQCIGELQNFDVFSRNSSGIIHSRRMVRDEEIRAKRSDGGWLSQSNQQNSTSEGTPKGTPEGRSTTNVSSSSSSSSSTKNKELKTEAQAPPAASTAIALVKSPNATRFTLQPIPEEWAKWAMSKRGWSVVHTQEVYEDFSDFWVSKSGADATHLNWTATWRRWVRKERSPTSQAGLGFQREGIADQMMRVARERIERGERV